MQMFSFELSEYVEPLSADTTPLWLLGLVLLLTGWLILRGMSRNKYFNPQPPPKGPRIGGAADWDGHHWQPNAHAAPSYCNVCKLLLLEVGEECLSCAICDYAAHDSCRSGVTEPCKRTHVVVSNKALVLRDQNKREEHQWVQCNFDHGEPPDCAACHRICGTLFALDGMHCVWCGEFAHEDCVDVLSSKCDLGRNAPLVLPPSCVVKLNKGLSAKGNNNHGAGGTGAGGAGGGGGGNGHEATVGVLHPIPQHPQTKPRLKRLKKALRRLRTPGKEDDARTSRSTLMLRNPPDGVVPLLVFVNSRSGGQLGGQLLWQFRRLLNPAQVFDLATCDGPQSGLQFFKNVKHYRVAVCGGDGTVGWVLSEIDKLHCRQVVPKTPHPKVKAHDKNKQTTPSRTPRTPSVSTVSTPRSRALSLETVPSDTEGGYNSDASGVLSSDGERYQWSRPPVAVLPLGTGNDLARVLGWGGGCQGVDEVDRFLQGVMGAHVAPLDRWQVTIKLPHDDTVDAINAIKTIRAGTHHATKKSVATVVHSASSSSDGAPGAVPENARDATDQDDATTKDASSSTTIAGAGAGAGAGAAATDSQTSAEVAEDGGLASISGLRRRALNVTSGGLHALTAAATTTSSAVAAATAAVTTTVSTVATGAGDSVASAVTSAVTTADPPPRVVMMQNYISIGVDAQAALDFHRQREANPERFTSQLGNKMVYAEAGARQAFERSLAGLRERVVLYADDVRVPLPDVEGLIILNIPSYAGGVDLWGRGSGLPHAPSPSFNDQRLEIVAVYGSFHLGKVHLGLSSALQLRQASTIRIEISSGEALPMQVDGEPWLQHPATISIAHNSTAFMLRRSVGADDHVARHVAEGLDAAFAKGVINRKQKAILLEELSKRIDRNREDVREYYAM